MVLRSSFISGTLRVTIAAISTVLYYSSRYISVFIKSDALRFGVSMPKWLIGSSKVIQMVMDWWIQNSSSEEVHGKEQEDDSSTGVDEVDFITPLVRNSTTITNSHPTPCQDVVHTSAITVDRHHTPCQDYDSEERLPNCLHDGENAQKQRIYLLQNCDVNTSLVLPCSCVSPGSGLIKVRGHVADVDPPLSSSSLDLLCGVCPRCSIRKRYTMIDHVRPLEIEQVCLRCSLETGDNIYLGLELYVILKIQDERDKSIMYNALAGEKMKKKFKFCSPAKYIANPSIRQEIWCRLKKVCMCKAVKFFFYLEKMKGGQYELRDIKVIS